MFSRWGTTEQRLHFEPQIFIAAAFALEECLTLARWSFQRRVEDPFDVPLPFGIHG